MSTPPNRPDDQQTAFQAGSQPLEYPQRKKRRREDQDDESVLEDVVEAATDAVDLGGCLFSTIKWFFLLPIRIVLRIIEAIFD